MLTSGPRLLCCAVLHLLLLYACTEAAVKHLGNLPGCDAWSYGNASGRGRDMWPIVCPDICAGKEQSPIDIPLDRLTPVSGPEYYEPLDIRFELATDTSKLKSVFFLKNAGYSIYLKSRQHFNVTGFGLPGLYYFDHIHWHWSDNPSGSEHSIGGRKYPLEGHFVTYNSRYVDVFDAVGEPDGLAIFTVFYDTNYNVDNPVYDFLTMLPKIPKAYNMYDVTIYDINYLLPTYKFPYYRYMGSLTTPPCDENVIWTVFSHTVSLSEAQMSLFRSSVYFKPGPNSTVSSFMQNNLRPLQSLNGRKVYVVDPSAPQAFIVAGQDTMTRFSCVLILAMLLGVLLHTA